MLCARPPPAAHRANNFTAANASRNTTIGSFAPRASAKSPRVMSAWRASGRRSSALSKWCSAWLWPRFFSFWSAEPCCRSIPPCMRARSGKEIGSANEVRLTHEFPAANQLGRHRDHRTRLPSFTDVPSSPFPRLLFGRRPICSGTPFLLVRPQPRGFCGGTTRARNGGAYRALYLDEDLAGRLRAATVFPRRRPASVEADCKKAARRRGDANDFTAVGPIPDSAGAASFASAGVGLWLLPKCDRVGRV